MSLPKNPKLTKIKEKEKGKNQQQHADFFNDYDNTTAKMVMLRDDYKFWMYVWFNNTLHFMLWL